MQGQLTDLEKHLFNKHLAVSRGIRNKPFRFRKDFGDLVDTDKHKFLKRISTLFAKHPEIDAETFFKAPYELYPDVQYFDLEYFSTMRAIKSYTTFRKTSFLRDPDSQLDQIKTSLHFIANFCIEQKIYFHQYPYHRSSDLYAWMTHYKENKINIYSMFEFSNIFSLAKELAEDVQLLFVQDFITKFQELFSMYNNSISTKPYIKKAFPILSNFVSDHINKTQKQ